MTRAESVGSAIRVRRLNLGAVAVVVGVIGALYYCLARGLSPGQVPSELQLSGQARLDSSRVQEVPETSAREQLKSGSARYDVEEPRTAAQTSEGEVLEEGTKAADLEAFYAQVRSRYLSTFLGESPDILGWNNYLGMLAADAELDPASVYDSPEGTSGNFVIPGTQVKVGFVISESSCKIESLGSVILPGQGNVEFQTSVSFEEAEGNLGGVHAVVQFFPEGEQRFYEDGPVGYLYQTGEDKTSLRPFRGEMRDNGKYWLIVPNEDSAQEINVGGLGWAYSWMHRLREMQPLRPAQTTQR